jgi:hypothetical protein
MGEKPIKPRRVLILWAVAGLPALAAGIIGYWFLFRTPVPRELPPDFAVEWSSGPCHADWGDLNFLKLAPKPDSTGRTAWVLQRGAISPPPPRGSNMVTKIAGEYPVSASECLELYRVVVGQRFFSLKEHYPDTKIIDGGSAVITVTANGVTKHVRVSNMTVKRFDRVYQAFNECCERVSQRGP